jgi:antitoxin CcdA
MTQTYNHSAKKKPTNVSINSDLLAKARILKLNISATLERALVEEVQKSERIQWLKQNKEAIESSNKLAERRGLFSDSYRTI